MDGDQFDHPLDIVKTIRGLLPFVGAGDAIPGHK